MSRSTDQVPRRDVIFCARIRVWCHLLNTRGRDAGLRSISDVGGAIERAIGGRAKSWLNLRDQLPQMLRGILPRDWEVSRTTSGETRFEFLVNAIDSLEEYRGSREVVYAPLWPLLSHAAHVPLQLSESIDLALQSLSLRRMRREDSDGDWTLFNGSQLERVNLSEAIAARHFSFPRSVEYCLGASACSSHQRMLGVLHVLALLRLESAAIHDYSTASTVHGVLDQVTTSATYEEVFRNFAEDVRKVLLSRIIWRPLEPLDDEPCQAKSSRSRKQHAPKQETTVVRVDRTRIGCVIAPVTTDPRRMDARTFHAITFGFMGTG